MYVHTFSPPQLDFNDTTNVHVLLHTWTFDNKGNYKKRTNSNMLYVLNNPVVNFIYQQQHSDFVHPALFCPCTIEFYLVRFFINGSDMNYWNKSSRFSLMHNYFKININYCMHTPIISHFDKCCSTDVSKNSMKQELFQNQ